MLSFVINFLAFTDSILLQGRKSSEGCTVRDGYTGEGEGGRAVYGRMG